MADRALKMTMEAILRTCDDAQIYEISKDSPELRAKWIERRKLNKHYFELLESVLEKPTITNFAALMSICLINGELPFNIEQTMKIVAKDSDIHANDDQLFVDIILLLANSPYNQNRESDYAYMFHGLMSVGNFDVAAINMKLFISGTPHDKIKTVVHSYCDPFPKSFTNNLINSAFRESIFFE